MSSIYPEVEKDIFREKTQIVRGPYLQQCTESSIIIRWATDVKCDSAVWYGTEQNRLDLIQHVEGVTCEHVVKLTGLKPDTKYYYAIGTKQEVLLGKTEDYFFVTAPSQARPIRVWVLGDAGRGNDIAASVRDGYVKFAVVHRADIWLMLGDNAYENGTYEEYQRGVFDTYPQILRNCVLWTAIGNHDAGSASSLAQTGPYYELFTPPSLGEAGGVPSHTAAYYSFDYGNIHFVCLDSYDSDRFCSGAMLKWLKQDLDLSNKDWKIAFWHHPPYTKGSHDSDTEIELIEMREQVLPLIERAGVDIVMCGHSHSYERSYLINGHYGMSNSFTEEMKKDGGSGREDESGAYEKSEIGTVYIVAGTSAFADHVSPHPAMYTSLSIPGSLILDVDRKKLDVKFIDSQGEIIDYFTIKKNLSL